MDSGKRYTIGGYLQMHEHLVTAPIRQGDSYALENATGSHLGDVHVDRVDGERIFGTFEPSRAFDALAGLFMEHDQAVRANTMSLAAEIEVEIEGLGLRLTSDVAARVLAIHHVQVFDRNRIFFHMGYGAYDSNGVDIHILQPASER